MTAYQHYYFILRLLLTIIKVTQCEAIYDLASQPDGDSVHSTCCLNGGICVLNTFCHCRRGYHGRRCEFSRRERNCGPVIHGDAFSDECNYCQCYDGVLTCIPIALNCDNVQSSSPEGPQVFNLRRHNFRHKKKQKSRLLITTTLHPLLVKVLQSGGASTCNNHQTPSTVLLSILLSLLFTKN